MWWVGTAASIVAALQQAGHTVPIVFVTTIDPVGSGLVASLARPGGNATGFIAYEFSIAGKWLELLKDIAPRVTRVAVLRNPFVPAGSADLPRSRPWRRRSGWNSRRSTRVPDEIEGGLKAFARSANDGLIMVGPPSSVQLHRDLIIALAARYRLPAVYSPSPFPLRRPRRLRDQCARPVSARGQLRRSYPQGREASRSSGAGVDQVRVGDQSQDR